MPKPRLSPLELRIMDVFWTRGALSIREVLEGLPQAARPAYTTVQTMVYRLESKQAVRRVRRIGNADIFEPVVARTVAHRRVLDDVLAVFGGRSQPLMAHLIESGRLTLEDLREAEKALRRHTRPEPKGTKK